MANFNKVPVMVFGLGFMLVVLLFTPILLAVEEKPDIIELKGEVKAGKIITKYHTVMFPIDRTHSYKITYRMKLEGVDFVRPYPSPYCFLEWFQSSSSN